jgi:hypothetical protein
MSNRPYGQKEPTMSSDYNYPNKQRSEKPPILTDVYGNRPPKAAELGKGVSDIAGVQEATDARREVKHGVYDHKR